jgi:hypothetical protein
MSPRWLRLFASCIAAASTAMAIACTHVQAPLPVEDSVASGTPLPIDGLWQVEPDGAHLRIDAGRVIADEVFLDGFFRVDPGMVVASRLDQRDADTFEGRDGIMGGRWHGNLASDGVLHVQLLRPVEVVSFTMVPVRLADPRWFAAQLASDRVARPPAIARPAPRPVPPVPEVRPRSEPPPTVPPAAASFGRYHALVIGNDAYSDFPSLRTARNDAGAIALLLERRYGFAVELLTDATREDILVALRDMRVRLTPEDNLLIYYAGHGWLDDAADEGYWLPVDATQDNEVNWIANSTVSTYFKAIRAKHILVVADSCYAGKLTRGIRVSSRTPSHFEELARRRARVVLTSGGLEPVEDDARGDHSAFASAFLDVLSQNQEVLDTSTLFARIRRPVMLASDQTPELADIRRAGHEGGDFLFVPVP